MELNNKYLDNQEFAEGKAEAQQQLSDKTTMTKRELEEEIEEREKKEAEDSKDEKEDEEDSEDDKEDEEDKVEDLVQEEKDKLLIERKVFIDSANNNSYN